MEKILITGGLGYLGGRVAKYLAQNTGYYILLGVRNTDIDSPTWLTNGEIIKLDILNDNQLLQACEGISIIIHFAAINEIDSFEEPELALRTNSLGTLKLLNCAVNAGIKRIIYFSTAHIYGELTGVISEKTLPRPTHPYAITHRVAEDFIIAAHDGKKITGIVLRLSNSFGVPERYQVNRWTLIVNDLCKQAVTTRKLVLSSTGLQQRDFITLHDVSRAVEHVILLPDVECGDGLFNLGGENPLHIIDLVYIISSRCEVILGFTPDVVRQESNANSSHALNYNIDKFKDTGFSLSGSVEREIDDTLKLCHEVFG